MASEFVAYLDAIGEVDGVRCLIDWKTTTSRYQEAPEGLFSLDPQLICHSWISGIPEAALVVFVRKHAPEVQYLRATISGDQREEFARLVETTVNQIEAGHFNPHSGIRFFGGSQPGRSKPRRSDPFAAPDLQITAARAAKPIPARDYWSFMSSLRPKQPRFRLDREPYEALRNQVLGRDNWRCQNSGAFENLHVHHIQWRSKLGHDSPENLITLCAHCHGKCHRYSRQ